MRTRDKQFGKPNVLYTATSSILSATSGLAGSIAWDLDSHAQNVHDGSDWVELSGGSPPTLLGLGVGTRDIISYSSYAFKGRFIYVYQDFDVYAIGSHGRFGSGTYVHKIIQADNTTGVITSILGTTYSKYCSGTVPFWIKTLFAEPVTLTAGNVYWIPIGRTDGGDSYQTALDWPAASGGDWASQHTAIWGTYYGAVLAKANPQVGDTLTRSSGTAYTVQNLYVRF